MLLAVLTLVALVLITLDYREGSAGPIATMQRGALLVFGPVQEAFATAVRPVGNFFSGLAELDNLRADNAELRRDVEALRERLPSVANLERENAQLRSLLDMREQLELTTTGARVIGQPPGTPEFTVLIDVGANQGVESGMAVVTAEGLVGKLTEVTPRYSRVELLTSPRARYAVRLASSGERGLLQGQGARPFRLEILDPEAVVEANESVITLTFQASTIPEGLLIGETMREQGADSVSRFKAVQPYVDFTELSFVQVVLDAPNPPEQLNPDNMVRDEKPPEPAPLTSEPTAP
ncbi:MAG: rod shape-determining protein MreC [Egibacteraceae bacterium]